MRSNILVFAVFLSNGVMAAECWITEAYKGYAAKERNGYAFETDGMSRTKYIIFIDGKNSKVVGSDLSFIQTANSSIIGFDFGENGESVIETWTIDPFTQKALMTQTRTGTGLWAGISAFVGEVVGDCKSAKEKIK